MNFHSVLGDNLRYFARDDTICSWFGSRLGSRLGSGFGCYFLRDGNEFERRYIFNGDVDHLTSLHVVCLLGDGVFYEFVCRVFVLNFHSILGDNLRYFAFYDTICGWRGLGGSFLRDRNKRIQSSLPQNNIYFLSNNHLVVMFIRRSCDRLFVRLSEANFHLRFVDDLQDGSLDGYCLRRCRLLADRFKGVWCVKLENHVDNFS